MVAALMDFVVDLLGEVSQRKKNAQKGGATPISNSRKNAKTASSASKPKKDQEQGVCVCVCVRL